MVQGRYLQLTRAAQAKLPRGGDLPFEEWSRRHHAMTMLLWGAAALIGLYSVLQGYGAWHTALEAFTVAAGALVASMPQLSRRARTLACSFGLLTASAMGVHVSGGVTEAHFSFFVVVVLLTLYEDWTVFALAVVYTLLHHGLLGTFAPEDVFVTHSANPWALGGHPRGLRGRRRRGRGRGLAAQRGRTARDARDPRRNCATRP